MKQETILLVINEQRREKIIKINELNAYRGKVKTHTHTFTHVHTWKNRLCIKYVIKAKTN